MKLPAAEKTRPTIGDIFVAVVIILAALTMIFLRPQSGDGELTAVITIDGEKVGQYALNEENDGIVIDLPSCEYPVTIELRTGGVRVAHTGCPNGDCEKCGWAKRAGEQIVCLPNRLVISVVGGVSEFDAVTGG